MEFIDIIILGLVQGLTEFLPVSSSGHLILTRNLFGISDISGNAIDAFLHLGTLCAVLVYYWKTWRELFAGALSSDGRQQKDMLGKLALATVPAAILGYFLQGWIEDFLRDPRYVAVALLVTASILFIADRYAKHVSEKKEPSYKDALLIGLAQVAALLPGISRSGVTMAAGRGRGLSRQEAARFSFLMSAPIIAGAGLTSVADLVSAATIPAPELIVGFIASFLAGLLAIFGIFKILEKSSFTPFIIYLVAASVLLFLTL
ncbi:MAG: undecaprenyl-diphosphate phosphatase [Candidatus Andersenbacteria bacterium]